jgi:thiosulfate dehydrogenase
MRTVFWTLVIAFIAVVVAAFVGVKTGLMPANADDKPGKIEHWAAKTSLHVSIERGMKTLHNPLPASDSVMTAGVRLYRVNCEVCHGGPDGKASSVAEGLYQKPPQFAKDDVTDDPIEMTYWKITHGIRFTGMPAYDKSLNDTQRWEIASFLRHQDSLPPNAFAAWKALKSAADTT